MENRAKHIAVIMDGNGRWATALGLPRSAGHKAGSEIISEITKAAIELKVECLTLFGLSCDNMTRPKSELNYLLNLTCKALEKYLPDLIEQGVQLRFIGDIQSLGQKVSQSIENAVKKTAHNEKLILVIAMNFSGTWHILETTKQLLKSKQTLTDDDIKKAFLALLPSSPDILIRTGGNQRLSDFIMFHLAYTELFFLDVRWPDFEKKHFEEVLKAYSNIERRFGQVMEKSV